MNAHTQPQTPLLDLDLLKTLVAIADTGNFSAAAEAVFRTPSAISMQVKRIEELLGRQIFIRSARRVELNEDGKMLVTHARRVLALNREIVSRFVAPDVSGTVRLGALDHAVDQFLPGVLCKFADSHPGVTVDVLIETSDILIDRFRKGQLDVAITTNSFGIGNDLQGETLYTEKLAWTGLRDGIAVEQNPLPVSVWEKGCVWREAALAGLDEQGRDYRVTFVSAHIAGQKAGVLADLAIAPMPISAAEGRIVALDASHGLPALPDYSLHMFVQSDASAPVQAVADNLRASCVNGVPIKR